ncbi:MAG: tRNA adenosine(34) deaminase TadA [candidate division KSB1 bacterium]|nr:tRNA adenosine(34) deaminase TadA [candidate division KSB1 bacterium]MDZ7303900.1 tRNA adenosine(34) deaminase TadA [candidate division KSB1 bacterium]MDZ7313176.1 tRNA adenosine(34) deaminase TadA [candidate division KSB1 bacterium]
MIHEHWMQLALKEAEKALEKGEVPIGAVVVMDNQIIGRGHNLVETLQDPTAHAEMIAITAAAGSVASWRLEGATLYVTVEPCPMCSGALLLSRISTLVYGTEDQRFGACGSASNVIGANPFGPPVETIAGIRRNECQALLQEFFKKLRQS